MMHGEKTSKYFLFFITFIYVTWLWAGKPNKDQMMTNFQVP